jgi:hypothetical protein
VLRPGQQIIVDDGQRNAAQGNGGQPPTQLESRRAAPVDAGKEAFVPKQRKDRDTEGQRDEIEDRLAAQKVVNIVLDLFLR